MSTDMYDFQIEHLKGIALKPDLNFICVKSSSDVRDSYQLWIVEESKEETLFPSRKSCVWLFIPEQWCTWKKLLSVYAGNKRAGRSIGPKHTSY